MSLASAVIYIRSLFSSHFESYILRPEDCEHVIVEGLGKYFKNWREKNQPRI